MKHGRLVSLKLKWSNPKTRSKVNASYPTLSNAGYTYGVYNHQGKMYQQNPLTPFLQKEHFFSIIPKPEESFCVLSQIAQLCFQEPCLQSLPLLSRIWQMIVQPSLRILTDGGVVATVYMWLVPMKFHAMSKGLWRPQMDSFQFSVLFCDEVSGVFSHFVQFLLFTHFMTPCPTSTATIRFAF